MGYARTPGDPYLQINAFALSDEGRVRRSNEDSFLAANLTERIAMDRNGILRFSSGPKGALFAVADGMGGAAAGEMASRLCIRVLYQRVLELIRAHKAPQPDSLEGILVDAVGTANARVYELGRSNEELNGMGTTLTAALEVAGHVVLGQIGDSRAYLVREGEIGQLTRDQSLVARMVGKGDLTEEEARYHPQRNILLQAVGVESKVEVALRTVNLQPYDVLLLCSDGLHNQISPEEMLEIMANIQDKRDVCSTFIELANERGGPDNITALLIQYLTEGDNSS